MASRARAKDNRRPNRGAIKRVRLLYDSVQPSSVKTYRSGQGSWAKFARKEALHAYGHGVEVEKAISRWVAVVASRNHHTARTHLNGVNHERRRRNALDTYAEQEERRRIVAVAKRTAKGGRGRGGVYARDLEKELYAVDADPSSAGRRRPGSLLIRYELERHGRYCELGFSECIFTVGAGRVEEAETCTRS